MNTPNKSIVPDFFCTYSKEFAELLNTLNIVPIFTTIDANKVVALRADEKNNIVQFLRNSDHPMGLVTQEDQLALATRSEMQLFKTNQSLSSTFPEHHNQFDRVYLPRLTYHCGNIDLHDLAFLNNSIVGVSSAYSCIVEFSDKYSFKPIWKPNFITDLKHEDRCHLNGLAVADGKIKYVTALGSTNEKEGWRKNIAEGGVLIDFITGEIVLDGFGAPHSPTLSGDDLFLALSATGEILKYNTITKSYSIIANLAGYVRGLVVFGEYLFVGLSKLRNKSSNAFDFPISKKQLTCGITVLSKNDGEIVAELRYEKDINEIYSIQLLTNSHSAILFNKETEAWKFGIETPNFEEWIK